MHAWPVRRFGRLTVCKNCEEGKWQDEPGAKECKFCPLGFAQDQLAESRCIECMRGQFGDLKG